ncbi:hypothetical protein WG66_011287 [Moniliophthora roreri]|nr:hypothetical protein WG66_011287 [Moniliophthora roreri]
MPPSDDSEDEQISPFIFGAVKNGLSSTCRCFGSSHCRMEVTRFRLYRSLAAAQLLLIFYSSNILARDSL